MSDDRRIRVGTQRIYGGYLLPRRGESRPTTAANTVEELGRVCHNFPRIVGLLVRRQLRG